MNINGTGPLVGPYLSDFLRAGPEFGATTLSRFYAIHMLLVPGLIAAMLGLHLYLVAKPGHDRPAVDEGRGRSRAARGEGVNRAEKEAYLREYSQLKAQGKPFFPYAVAKDSLMAVIVMAAIILMSLTLGAELGPKADPTTTTYVPRPEWYFFFLFEVLRIIKPPALVPLATIGVPTICMILLFLLPFYDRSPERRPERRPIATTAGIFVIAAMAYLTYQGASAGSPTQIDLKTPAVVQQEGGKILAEFNAGKEVAPQAGCLACHKIGDNGNDGPGPPLTHIGSRLPRAGDRPHAGEPDGADAVLQGPSEGQVRQPDGVPVAAQVSEDAAERGRLPDEQVRSMFDRIAGFYDLGNQVMTAGLHHRWRARAADLAEVGPGSKVLDVATGTGDLAVELRDRGCVVTGSDFSEEMLVRARAKAPDIEFAWGDARTCPTRTTHSTRRRSASAHATSATWRRASARWRGSCGRAGRS